MMRSILHSSGEIKIYLLTMLSHKSMRNWIIIMLLIISSRPNEKWFQRLSYLFVAFMNIKQNDIYIIAYIMKMKNLRARIFENQVQNYKQNNEISFRKILPNCYHLEKNFKSAKSTRDLIAKLIIVKVLFIQNAAIS